MPKLTHIDKSGQATMVDVSAKPAVRREAVGTGKIVLQAGTVDLIRQNGLKKGDVLCVARIAAMQAAKQTQQLIPLCHPLPLENCAVELHPRAAGPDGSIEVAIDCRELVFDRLWRQSCVGPNL